MMNLRHKKPLNSYRGQANSDKNEFNDDDFRHQSSSHKKYATSSAEQMHKYAKILAKFITNTNQFYRETKATPRKNRTFIEDSVEESKREELQSMNVDLWNGKQQHRQRKAQLKLQKSTLNAQNSTQAKTLHLKYQNNTITPKQDKYFQRAKSGSSTKDDKKNSSTPTTGTDSRKQSQSNPNKLNNNLNQQTPQKNQSKFLNGMGVASSSAKNTATGQGNAMSSGQTGSHMNGNTNNGSGGNQFNNYFPMFGTTGRSGLPFGGNSFGQNPFVGGGINNMSIQQMSNILASMRFPNNNQSQQNKGNGSSSSSSVNEHQLYYNEMLKIALIQEMLKQQQQSSLNNSSQNFSNHSSNTGGNNPSNNSNGLKDNTFQKTMGSQGGYSGHSQLPNSPMMVNDMLLNMNRNMYLGNNLNHQMPHEQKHNSNNNSNNKNGQNQSPMNSYLGVNSNLVGALRGINPLSGLNSLSASQQKYLQQQQYDLHTNLRRMPEPPIYNLTDILLSRKESVWNTDKERPNKAVKRGSFHVGIAYHIHLSEWDKKSKQQKEMCSFDPTKKSRQIKQREQKASSKKQSGSRR